MINQASIMMDLEGTELAEDEINMLANPLIGGLILFSRNFESSEQLRQLIKNVRAAASQPILIAVDNEGGRVQRFKTDEFTHIPAMGSIMPSDQTKVDAEVLQQVKELAWLLASECLAHGIDLSFAPVLDLERGSDVVGDRAFHHDPQVTIQLAQSWCEGMTEAGMACVGKHFPGHGSTKEDSHIAAPKDIRSFQQIEQSDLAVFQAMIASNHLQALMPAHIEFSQVDKNPVGYSTRWIQDILKSKLGFNGLLFSDDLSMIGAGEHLTYTQRVLKAINAGCDMVLICNNKQAVQEVLKELSPQTILGDSKVHGLMAKSFPNSSELIHTQRYFNAVKISQTIKSKNTA